MICMETSVYWFSSLRFCTTLLCAMTIREIIAYLLNSCVISGMADSSLPSLFITELSKDKFWTKHSNSRTTDEIIGNALGHKCQVPKISNASTNSNH